MVKNTREYQRDYQRRYRYAGREQGSVRHSSLARPFVGCDGEGATLDNGYHAYFMLRIGDQTLKTYGKHIRLTTYDCLDFISNLDPSNIYVGYYFDYDVTKILEDLPFGKLRRLMSRASRMGLNGQLFPVDYLDFQLDYLPRKEFKVRKKLSQTDTETVWSPWIVINDVGSFFQCSFLDAIKAWKIGTEDEHNAIQSGKAQRATFDITSFDEIAEYNALEISLLQTLMESFRQATIKAGYVPRKWQGPGILAETMLRSNGVAKSRDVELLTTDNFRALVQFATNAYYGGRSEVAFIGPIETPVFQYDINSAYPYAMKVVPCLKHPKDWRYIDDPAEIANLHFDKPTGTQGESFALLLGAFRPKDATIWYGLPVRTQSGTIVFPASGKGWYWSFEIDSSIHQTFVPESVWVYTRSCLCTPLSFVEEIYKIRQSIGKDGPGVVLKLGMNSIYGKLVQSIGFPKYSNPIWGSFITAYPRMMIQEFIHSSPYCKSGKCGRDIVMVATDSLATIIERDDYPESKELGGWSRETHSRGMFVVQPGVYFGSSGKRIKTRGVPRTVIESRETDFRSAFQRLVTTGNMYDGQVRVAQKIFCGLRYALHRRDMRLLGQWLEFGEDGETGKIVSFDWSTKRALYPALAPQGERTWIQTFPYMGDTAIVSVPYSKDIGGLRLREALRLAFADQPDWAGQDYDWEGLE